MSLVARTSSIPITARGREAKEIAKLKGSADARPPFISRRQVAYRFAFTDVIKRIAAIGCLTMPSSDWRQVELLLCSNWEFVLYFSRQTAGQS